MWSSSGTLLFLLLCVAIGAVVEDTRNFIQAPALCEPPFAFINGRCVFVVERESSDEIECSDDSGAPCRKKDYPSKSLLPGETVLYEDAITDRNNKNQLNERNFVGTRDCKQGFIFMWGKCREIFNGKPIDDMLVQQLDGDFNSVDNQIEDIYNTQSIMNQEIPEKYKSIFFGTERKCKPGYKLDSKGRCREIFNPASSNFQNEDIGHSASAKEVIKPGLSPCKPGYRHDWNGHCREIFNPASSNTQVQGSDHSAAIKHLIQVGLSPCKPGFIRDEKGNCREIFTPSNTKKEQNGRVFYGKALIPAATSACKAGYQLDSRGRCRKVYTPVSGHSQNELSGEDESTKGLIQVPGCAAGFILMQGDCRPVYSGKREVYGEDYVDTNESPLMQRDLLRRRRSFQNQDHQEHLFSGSEE